ncbi:MAG: hypothetical protein ACYCOU_24720 [Sulfobacillus sp.]
MALVIAFAEGENMWTKHSQRVVWGILILGLFTPSLANAGGNDSPAWVFSSGFRDSRCGGGAICAVGGASRVGDKPASIQEADDAVRYELSKEIETKIDFVRDDIEKNSPTGHEDMRTKNLFRGSEEVQRQLQLAIKTNNPVLFHKAVKTFVERNWKYLSAIKII